MALNRPLTGRYGPQRRQVSDSALLDRLKTDEQSTLSRIEKLFPHDDLELNSSQDKKPRRRRSAPSQMLLKNLYRRSAPGGGEVGFSKVSQDSTASAPEVPLSPTDYVSRKFIYESAVQLSAGVQTQHRYLFLFNDLLFIAKQRSSTSYKLKKRVLVPDIWISDYVPGVSEVGNLDASKSFVIGWPTTNHIATFTTKELCDKWKEKLKQQINDEQSQDQPPNTTVEVVHKNALLEHMSTTLTLDKLADAKELLQMTLQAFAIQNLKDADYQLWVLSTKDDSIYPLFGHEQPFAIQRSHERDAEELDSSIKCQFILRENKKQMKLDRKPQKSGKKKKLPLSNIFGRKASGKLPSSPRSNSISEGKIFGHPLDEICDPDIPTPLMELLENLYNYGPFTTEIFRKPSNAKRCQEMVNLMNSVDPKGWCKGCHNGILFASMLKTFLRELPGYICCSEYYNQWSNAINLSNDEDRRNALVRIIERLPKGNQLVLRYIICILSHIQVRSNSNLMNSSNLAVCLGPSLLWNESSEKSEQEASSKTVPQIVQFLIDNCQSVFGREILDIFGHPPTAPPDSDSEDLTNDRLLTPYNDSLESLSDTEGARVMGGGLTQMSPSSCSRDSGLILSDPHEGEQSDDHSLRQEIIKSKSCDSLSQPEHRNLRTTLAPLQTQVSSDSLDCDDEYIELGSDYNFLLTKSRSGGHLCFDKEAEKPSNRSTATSTERLRSRLASVASRYSAEMPSTQDVEYSSSDSDKSAIGGQKTEWPNTELHKSSTNSSLQQGSSSSDDTHGLDLVTHRHINSPKILESENGYHPRDFLHQFTNKLQNEETHKKKLRELMRQKTEPILPIVNTDTDDDDITQSIRQSTAASRGSSAHRHLKHANSTGRGSPRITRTNTYGGKSDRKQRAPDVNMVANMAETRPIMPQQYRPNRPPPYREAVERKEKMRSGISEMERIKQTVNSARAKQLYAQSLQLFEQQGVNKNSHSDIRNTAAEPVPPSHSASSGSTRYSKLSLASLHNNNNTIGIVQTNEKKFVIKRAASTKHPLGTDNIFYQPSSGGQNAHRAPLSSSNSFANSFYRPTQPPPYKEAMKTRTSKPDLIDSLGGESLV